MTGVEVGVTGVGAGGVTGADVGAGAGVGAGFGAGAGVLVGSIVTPFYFFNFTISGLLLHY